MTEKTKKIIKTCNGPNGSMCPVDHEIVEWPKFLVISPDNIKRYIKGMIDYAKRDDALKITEYLYNEGASASSIQKWMAEIPEFKEAYDTASAMIGNRREKGALTGKLSPYVVMKTMPMYDKQYKELREWEARLTAREQALASTSTIQVIMQAFPKTDIVPDREEK